MASQQTELISFENGLNTSDYFMQIMKIFLKCRSVSAFILFFLEVFFVVKQKEKLIITNAL